ncbi:MAG: hypothetical protein JNM85_11130 [Chthonomonas sp.]|nr:hypothetical protein [Chthonomonas sp.]
MSYRWDQRPGNVPARDLDHDDQARRDEQETLVLECWRRQNERLNSTDDPIED